MFGGSGNDTLTGGTGNDSVFGEAGNDRMIWNPGDGTDLNEGGAGIDTVEVNGGNGAETFTVTPNGTRVRFDRTDPAPFSIDIGTSENLVLNANDGNDTFTASNGLAASDPPHRRWRRGQRHDHRRRRQRLSATNDHPAVAATTRPSWAPATTRSFGTPATAATWSKARAAWTPCSSTAPAPTRTFDLSANGSRLRLFRDVGNVTMDVNDVEQVNVAALGGADTVTVNDLSGTDVTDVNLDLAGTPGSGTGDGQADTVIVNGTAGHDAIAVAGKQRRR